MPDLYDHETPEYLQQLAYQLRHDGLPLDAIADELGSTRREITAWITAHETLRAAKAAEDQPSLFDQPNW